MYGEWLREQFEKGEISQPAYNPDLAILLAQVRKNSIALSGPKATEILEPVPMTDIRRAIKESLPGLLADLKGDERNVILTLQPLPVRFAQKIRLQNGLYPGCLKNMRLYST